MNANNEVSGAVILERLMKIIYNVYNDTDIGKCP